MRALSVAFLFLIPWTALFGQQKAVITIRPAGDTYPVSPYLTGACMEDLNHEVYGGLYSQMIFGESFQEPPSSQQLDDFDCIGNSLRTDGQVVSFLPGCGRSALVARAVQVGSGTVAVDVRLSADTSGAAGIIFKADSNPQKGKIPNGYTVVINHDEVRLYDRKSTLARFPHKTPAKTWTRLEVSFQENHFSIKLDGQPIGEFTDAAPDTSTHADAVGVYNEYQPASYRNFTVTVDSKTQALSFKSPESSPPVVSDMWVPLQQNGAKADFALLGKGDGYIGKQSQRVVFLEGPGRVGVANEGVKHIGLVFEGGKPYEGILRVRTPQASEIEVTMEDRAGTKQLASTILKTQASPDWQRLTFTLSPSADEKDGRFTISLHAPGTLDLGYAFLQPGEWGRYKGLPVRKDLAEALINEGLTVIRYGGSMIGTPEYRWKHMLGPRDERVPYSQCWYGYDTNGWGIIDLLNFGEASGILCIPAVNRDETPQDLADFIEYVNGSPDSEWGKRRVADGHPAPYHLKVLELGNEEHVDEKYFAKFKPLAEAIWAKDPSVILTVGDWSFGKPITDPFHIAPGGPVTTLAAHQEILALAKAHNAEVWFDYHIETHRPQIEPALVSLPSYVQALEKLSGGAKFKVVCYEFNAAIHNFSRGLSDALAVNVLERQEGRVPVACVANATELDGECDAFDQGSIFFRKDHIWLQPPSYVTQMISQHHQPMGIPCEVSPSQTGLDAVAERSADGATLTLRVVNTQATDVNAALVLDGYQASDIQATQIKGDLKAENPADHPTNVIPQNFPMNMGTDGKIEANFPGYSLVVIEIKSKAR